MSSYAVFYLEKLNEETGLWEYYTLYRKDKDGNYSDCPLMVEQGDIRDITSEELMDAFNSVCLKSGHDEKTDTQKLSEGINAKYKSDEENSFSYIPRIMAITLPEFKNWLLNNPKSYSNWTNKKIKNPLWEVYDAAKSMIMMVGDDWLRESLFRIVYTIE